MKRLYEGIGDSSLVAPFYSCVRHGPTPVGESLALIRLQQKKISALYEYDRTW